MKKELLITVLLFISLISILAVRYVGFVVQTPSSVTVYGCGDGTCGANETCSSCPGDCGSCSVPQTPSGGGGGAGASVSEFSLDKDLIKVSIKQGETQRETIEIMNTGNTGIDIAIEAESLKNFLAISEQSFYLESRKTRLINLDFFAKENEKPDAYTGRIIIKSGKIQKIINVIIEVKEKRPLFDIKTEVENPVISPGDKVTADISLTNLGDLRNIDVMLYYAIRDFEGNTISFKEESLAINTSISIKRELVTPQDIPLGEYVFYSRVSYQNVSAASVYAFKVKKSNLEIFVESRYFWVTVILLIALVAISAIIAYLFYIRALSKILERLNKPFAERVVEESE